MEIAKKAKMKGIKVNLQLVEIGSLLHDIGRARSNRIDHAHIGSTILKSLNITEPIVKIVERHIGSGITADEAVKLGLPNKDFIPTTLEEKIVSYADKLIEGNRVMGFDEALTKFSASVRSSQSAITRLKSLNLEIGRLIEN